ncbi:hypothetical protein C2G38_2218934 [Gigaspora rosea]|uniref:Uncharacterized protein n=1 Tax=Gigaspora rosea TaxID=44941 RepID=A0A397U9I3_9GLOM|nr:hypothetical protein C2G38_2218934 [Gigaspora rosea]
MNNIFGNRENGNPDYLINSTGQIYGTSLEQKSNESKDSSLKSDKKRRLNEDEIHYIKSMDTITESKKIEAETRKKLYDLEKDKFEYEREKEKERLKFEQEKEKERLKFEQEKEKERLKFEREKWDMKKKN